MILTLPHNRWQLTTLVVVCLIVNTALLSINKLTSVPHIRARNGNISRLFFFFNAIVVFGTFYY
jgi:hypothetical protein